MKYDLWKAGQPDQVELEYFEIPPAVKAKSSGPSLFDIDPASLKTYLAGLQSANVHGTRAVLRLKDGPVILRRVPVRAVSDWFMARMLSEQIAKYLVLRHATKLLNLAETPNPSDS
jgi:hypothetical protein